MDLDTRYTVLGADGKGLPPVVVEDQKLKAFGLRVDMALGRLEAKIGVMERPNLFGRNKNVANK